MKNDILGVVLADGYDSATLQSFNNTSKSTRISEVLKMCPKLEQRAREAYAALKQEIGPNYTWDEYLQYAYMPNYLAAMQDALIHKANNGYFH